MLATLRRSGNSFVVTIPRNEVERVGASEGDLVEVEVRPVEVRPRLTPEQHAALDAELARPAVREGLEYLGR